jgi:hypothetical protein
MPDKEPYIFKSDAGAPDVGVPKTPDQGHPMGAGCEAGDSHNSTSPNPVEAFDRQAVLCITNRNALTINRHFTH